MKATVQTSDVSLKDINLSSAPPGLYIDKFGYYYLVIQNEHSRDPNIVLFLSVLSNNLSFNISYKEHKASKINGHWAVTLTD